MQQSVQRRRSNVRSAVSTPYTYVLLEGLVTFCGGNYDLNITVKQRI